jgi:hypothetical protein
MPRSLPGLVYGEARSAAADQHNSRAGRAASAVPITANAGHAQGHLRERQAYHRRRSGVDEQQDWRAQARSVPAQRPDRR